MSKEKSDQVKHDECVRTIADTLKRENWEVKANVEGYEKPSEKGKITPDIEAHKGCLKRICQVATLKDFEGNKARYMDFRNYCNEYDFKMYVIGKDGKRKEIDPETFGKKQPNGK